MDTTTQVWQYTKARFQLSRDEDNERGEISATTIVWAAALVAAAIAVSGILVGKIRTKANGINL